MELLFAQTVAVTGEDLDKNGNMKLSAMLRYMQQVSEGHCQLLGCHWDALAEMDLFWAVLRHRLVIRQMPHQGQRITLQTWPMPTTRAAYPRAVQALDETGAVLFEAVSLWVPMHIQSRAMARAGRCGVEVPGILRGCEIDPPGAILPGSHQNHSLWTVTQADLDINGHVNNACYLEHTQNLAEGRCPRELTVCYLSECRLGQQVMMDWTVSDEGVLTVDGCRRRTDVPEKTERVFALRITCA